MVKTPHGPRAFYTFSTTKCWLLAGSFSSFFAGGADAAASLDIGHVSDNGIRLIIAFAPGEILRGDGASGQGRRSARQLEDANAERCAYRSEADDYFSGGGIKRLGFTGCGKTLWFEGYGLHRLRKNSVLG